MSVIDDFNSLVCLYEKYTLIEGFVDIIEVNNCYVFVNNISENILGIENFTVDSFWILSGKGSNEIIYKDIKDFEPNLKREGYYNFKALLNYEREDYPDYNYGFYNILHIEFNFLSTFEARKRDDKIDNLLNFF